MDIEAELRARLDRRWGRASLIVLLGAIPLTAAAALMPGMGPLAAARTASAPVVPGDPVLDLVGAGPSNAFLFSRTEMTVGMAFGRAAGYPRSRGQISSVRHVVLLDMENHTLENLFGFPCAKGVLRNCPASVAMPSSVTLADGVKVKPSVLPDTIPNVPHTPHNEALGLHNQWDQIPACGPAKAPRTRASAGTPRPRSRTWSLWPGASPGAA